MTERRLRIDDHLYFVGLILLVAGLPVSLFLTSLSQFFLGASMLAGGDFLTKLRRFLSNKSALLITGIWLLHVVGMLWTSDFNEGMKDLRIKLPLLLMPLFIAGNNPLSPERFRWVLLAFVGAVFCGSMVSMAVLVGIIKRNVYDIRDVFIFNISHIRFALFTCLSIFILFYFLFVDTKRKVSKTLLTAGVVLMAWLIAFLIIVVSITGLIILAATIAILLFLYGWRRSNARGRLFIASGIFTAVLLSMFAFKKMVSSYGQKHSYSVVTEKTSLGNDYDPPHADTLYENNYPVWMYVSEKELREAWNQVSRFPYDSLDERTQPIRMTLIRFLTSKGLRKDAEGLQQLSQQERRSIERGVANVDYQKISSLRSRAEQIVWEFDYFLRFGSVSGHSVTQRFAFWDAGWKIGKANFLMGVGTGDMPRTYEQYYESINSPLDKDHRLRAHNQFLAILVAFGIIGLIYFVFAIGYPLLANGKSLSFLFSAYFIIVLLSMQTEDTLETQAGATFFALFFSLLLFGRTKHSDFRNQQ